MTSALEILAERIRDRRKICGLSQEMLAERTGLSLSLIRRIERNVANPTLSNLEKIARVLEIDMADLFNDNSRLDTNSDKKNTMLRQLGQLSSKQLTLLLKFIKSFQ